MTSIIDQKWINHGVKQALETVPSDDVLVSPPSCADRRLDPQEWDITMVQTSAVNLKLRNPKFLGHSKVPPLLQSIEIAALDLMDGENEPYEQCSKISLREFTEDLLETSFKAIHDDLKKEVFPFEQSNIYILKGISKIISKHSHTGGGNSLNVEVNKIWNGFWKIYNQRFIHSVDEFRELIGLDQPMLVMGIQNEFVKVFRLHRKFILPGFFKGTFRFNSKDLAEPIQLVNPVRQVVKGTYEAVERAVRQNPSIQKARGENQLFLEFFKKERRISGQGDFRGFSIYLFRNGDKWLAECSLSMGNKPFLQQVCEEPVFVLWDIRRNPIDIFFQLPIEAAGRIVPAAGDLNSIPFYARSTHPSILRHAFVQSVDKNSYTGSICMENTRERILALHRGRTGLDPFLCLLEQMRAANGF